MGLAPVRRRGRFCRLQFERRKPPILIRALPQGLRVTGGNCRQGVFRAGASDTTSSHAGPGRAEPPLSGRRPWGKVFFSQPRGGARTTQSARPDDDPRPPAVGQQGTGGENTPGGRPGRCTLDLVARVQLCAQRLDGSRDSAIHTKYRDFATFFIDRESQDIPLSSRVRLPCSRSDAKATPRGTFASSFAWHRDRRKWLFVCSPRPSLVADAEPAGAGREREARDSTGVATAARRRWASRCSSLALVASFRGIDNDPSAGSPTETLLRLLLPLNDKVQWTFSRTLSAANRQRRRDPNTSPDHSIGRSDGRCVQRAGT
ncbi:hypothetical protein H6P81_015964 [Aristolochia fimbriata]|uniref:Uncharacterized protein n=1 Tax=Aristolochia fimbriata TaxID=158543 RepID=A0AAV7E8R0_ARIFI|nr:hypothetical protein H6P81_015964 [Aristolochia fimbriata]